MHATGRSMRPRKVPMPQKAALAPCPISELGACGGGGTPAENVRGLLKKLANQRCNRDVARSLLKLMTDNCFELEKNHPELMSAVMMRVYSEVISADDPLVRLLLLHLVELRARNWRYDQSAELFYASRRQCFASQQWKTEPERGFGDGAATLKKGRQILKATDQGTALRPINVHRPAGKSEEALSSSMTSAQLRMAREFEAVKSSHAQLDLLRTGRNLAAAGASGMVAPSTGRPLRAARNLFTLASEEQKIIEESHLESCEGKEGHISERNGELPPLARDKKPSKSSDVPDDGETGKAALLVETKQSDDVAAGGTTEVDGCELPSGRTHSTSGGTPCKEIDENSEMETKLEDGCLAEGGAGDGNLQNGSMLPVDGNDESQPAVCDGKLVSLSPPESSETKQVGRRLCSRMTLKPDSDDEPAAVADSDEAETVQYDREFLLSCQQNIGPKNLPDIWPELCAGFRGICLPPEEAKPIFLPFGTAKCKWSIVRSPLPPPR